MLRRAQELLERAYSASRRSRPVRPHRGHARGGRSVAAAQVVTTVAPVTIVLPGQRVRDLWLTNGTPQNTADDTQLVADGAWRPGCAPVDLATTDFTREDGDAYPFTAQG